MWKPVCGFLNAPTAGSINRTGNGLVVSSLKTPLYSSLVDPRRHEDCEPRCFLRRQQLSLSSTPRRKWGSFMELLLDKRPLWEKGLTWTHQGYYVWLYDKPPTEQVSSVVLHLTRFRKAPGLSLNKPLANPINISWLSSMPASRTWIVFSKRPQLFSSTFFRIFWTW